MGLPQGTSHTLFIGIAIGGLGLVLHIVGMATPAWSPIGIIDYGAFRTCISSRCFSTTDAIVNDESKAKAVQAMTIIGTLVGAMGLSAALAVVVLAVLGKEKISILPKIAMAAGIVSFAFILVGLIVWLTLLTGDVHIGYSWILCLIGGILLAASGVIVFKDGKSVSPRVGDA